MAKRARHQGEPVHRADDRASVEASAALGVAADRAAHRRVLPRAETGARVGPRELERLGAAATRARTRLGLEVAAGHGLTRHNVGPVVAIPEIAEVNIGHSVIADAVLFGLERAVRDLRAAIDRGAAEGRAIASPAARRERA